MHMIKVTVQVVVDVDIDVDTSQNLVAQSHEEREIDDYALQKRHTLVNSKTSLDKTMN